MSEFRSTLKLDSLTSLFKLNHTARMFMALYLDRRVSAFYKIAAAGGVIYKFSPLDVEPDAITGVGLMDDIIVSLIIMQAFIELAPSHVIDEKCEKFGIDRRKVFVDVPQTIEDAQQLYRMAKRYGLGARQVMEGFSQQASDFSPPAGPPPRAPDSATGDTGEGRSTENEEAAEPPRYSSYSAFNPED